MFYLYRKCVSLVHVLIEQGWVKGFVFCAVACVSTIDRTGYFEKKVTFRAWASEGFFPWGGTRGFKKNFLGGGKKFWNFILLTRNYDNNLFSWKFHNPGGGLGPPVSLPTPMCLEFVGNVQTNEKFLTKCLAREVVLQVKVLLLSSRPWHWLLLQVPQANARFSAFLSAWPSGDLQQWQAWNYYVLYFHEKWCRHIWSDVFLSVISHADCSLWRLWPSLWSNSFLSTRCCLSPCGPPSTAHFLNLTSAVPAQVHEPLTAVQALCVHLFRPVSLVRNEVKSTLFCP